MLSITGLRNFYFLPGLHDMRCKAPRIFEIIRAKYHRDPLNGDVYMFMSKDQTKVKMIHYENPSSDRGEGHRPPYDAG